MTTPETTKQTTTGSRLLTGLMVVAALGAAAIGACERARAGPQVAEEAAMMIGPENIVVADTARIETGPSISGTLTAEREAAIVSQISGGVLATPVEPGQSVASGQLLVRLDPAGIQDSYFSARAAVLSAEAALRVAQRNLERSEKLSIAGAIADQDLENARYQATNAEAQAADARSRLAAAQKQLGYTTIRAPFAGVVSERPVKAGDVVQAGARLITIIDPSSLRLEAQVPAEQLSALRVGAPVLFTVTGYPGRELRGRVARINPAVDPVTRQVPITVTLPNSDGKLVAGLFAEGRVAMESRTGITVPQAAVDSRGLRPTVLRVKEGRVQQVEVELGLADDATERVEVVKGLAVGDTVLLGSALSIPVGSLVRVTAPAEQVPATPAAR